MNQQKPPRGLNIKGRADAQPAPAPEAPRGLNIKGRADAQPAPAPAPEAPRGLNIKGRADAQPAPAPAPEAPRGLNIKGRADSQPVPPQQPAAPKLNITGRADSQPVPPESTTQAGYLPAAQAFRPPPPRPGEVQQQFAKPVAPPAAAVPLPPTRSTQSPPPPPPRSSMQASVQPPLGVTPAAQAFRAPPPRPGQVSMSPVSSWQEPPQAVAPVPPSSNFAAIAPPKVGGVFGEVRAARPIGRESTPTVTLSTPSGSQITEYTDSQGTIYCLISAGEYVIGKNQERVTVRVPYGISKYPVTKAQFFAFMSEKELGYSSLELNEINRISPYPNSPMVMMSWSDAKNYCRWLRGKSNEFYNLPSAQEWEVAARGLEGFFYPWGNSPEPNLGLCLYNDGVQEPTTTASVDYYIHNTSPFGCLGMVGNVMEWTNDSFDDPRDPHQLRGGSWRSGPEFCNTITPVYSWPATKRENYFGLRLLHVPQQYFKEYYMENMMPRA